MKNEMIEKSKERKGRRRKEKEGEEGKKEKEDGMEEKIESNKIDRLCRNVVSCFIDRSSNNSNKKEQKRVLKRTEFDQNRTFQKKKTYPFQAFLKKTRYLALL